MPGDLKQEPPVPPLIQELVLRQSPDRQAAQDKRARTKAEVLISLLALDPNDLNAADTAELLFGDEKVGMFGL
jgi:hypothetical protein